MTNEPSGPVSGSFSTDASSELAPRHLMPREQPESVHQLTSILFAPYQVDGGQVQLEGCRLEDVPFLMLEVEGGRQYYDQQGQLLSRDFADSLGLGDLVAMEQGPRNVRPQQIQRWLGQVESCLGGSPSGGGGELRDCGRAIVWCKWAEGKLAFRIGESSQAVGFQGWAVHLLKGRVKPPELVCRRSGCRSYHVLATSAGELTTPEAVGVCTVTGERRLRLDLETCQVSGKLALPKYLVDCEATGARMLSELAQRCDCCEQRVSPEATHQGVCLLCRSVSGELVADVSSGWSEWVVEQSSAIRWRRFEGAEGPRYAIWTARRLTHRRLWVVRRDDQSVVRIRERVRWQSRWKTIFDLGQEETRSV